MDTMFTPTFHLGLGIDVIGLALYISLREPIHLFGLLLNREIGLIVHLFDI